MTIAAPADWAERLPEAQREEIRAEIAQVIAGLPEGASCVATGSLVEGIGNANSDVDLYVIGEPGAPSRPTSIGIRGARYVDCEYFDLDSITRLCNAFDEATPETAHEFALHDFDRYYRLSIAARVLVSDGVAEVLDRCSASRSREVYAGWAAARSRDYVSKAVVEHALGRAGHAAVIIREAALWRATSVLAAEGEGYPSLKWATVKAARRFGTGTAAYLDCLHGSDAMPEDVPAVCDWLRERLPSPADTDSCNWALRPNTTVFDEGATVRLMAGRRTVVEVDGALRPVLLRLGGGTWTEAIHRTAVDLRVPAQDLNEAVAKDADELVNAEILEKTTGREQGR